MGEILRLFILACGIIFALLVIRLLIKKKISERNSLVWLGATLAILLVSSFPTIVDWVATKLHISYPPTLLFLFSTLILLLVTLHQSTQISIMGGKLKELAQHVALSSHVEEHRDPRPLHADNELSLSHREVAAAEQQIECKGN